MGQGEKELHVGATLAGKYVVEALLGSGGMGTVVRARHVLLHQPVAIKVLHGELLQSAEAARRFANEARATASLKSPNTVRIIDIDHLPSGRPFIVMELLEGTNLAKLVQDQGPLPALAAVQYVLQATGALVEAHARGIVHRDLKPENMILTKDYVVKVVDFGLAKYKPPRLAVEGPPSSDTTGTHALLGSPCYMSPEQLRSARDVDHRADIWGLGVTLYHLLTGEPPFMAPNLPILAAVIETQPVPRIAERRADVTPGVDTIVGSCLRKDPADRPQTVGALQVALAHLLGELQTRGLGTTGVAKMTMPATTRRAPAAALVPAPPPPNDDEDSTMVEPSRIVPDSEPPTMADAAPEHAAPDSEPPTFISNDAPPSEQTAVIPPAEPAIPRPFADDDAPEEPTRIDEVGPLERLRRRGQPDG